MLLLGRLATWVTDSEAPGRRPIDQFVWSVAEIRPRPSWHITVDRSASGPASSITAGWHTLVRVGRAAGAAVLDGLRTNTVAVTATGSWSIYKWQFFSIEALDEAYVPFIGAFGAAWDNAMVARWSADPLGML